ncbi:MAG: hypothetical protein JNK56_08655 [Myxococcales bacterium]|nr:hypothetical protein [Myxococcales bacterium]
MAVGLASTMAVGGALVLLAACNPPVREAVGVPAAPEVPTGPMCAATPAGALARVV